MVFDDEDEELDNELDNEDDNELGNELDNEQNEDVPQQVLGSLSDSRICKFSWIEDRTHKHIQNINQRIKDMTKLSMATAESLQIANYGIGGHYDPHYDCSAKYERPMRNGNRIATVLFYVGFMAFVGQ